jgi:hypothetical protein
MVRGALALGVLFFAAFAFTRPNPNASIFLFAALVCGGLALLALLARGVPQLGGGIRDRTGRSERDLLVGGLLLIALLTPWSVGIPILHWHQVFGWQSPVALLSMAALVVANLRRSGRDGRMATLVAALGLVAWGVGVAVQLLTPPFRASGFPFLPIDLLGEGWYVGLLALAVTVDGLAAEASHQAEPARAAHTWPFAILPGMALVRLHYPIRGRLFLIAAAFAGLLVQANAIGPEEFQYYGSLGSLPPARPRGGVLIPVVLGLVIWLLSLWDTRHKLRLERTVTEP